jgi:hypothetical protein
VRFLVLVCLLCLLASGTTLPASAASQQVCLPTVQGSLNIPPNQAGTVLINEVLLSSKKSWSCPGATSVPGSTDNSWIELYNPMSLSFNLYAVHAAIDGGSGTTPLYLPFGSAIAAHGFLTVFPNKNIIFLNGSTKTLTRRLLFNGSVIDTITLPANLGDDQSYARIPDGASKWEITNTPTIGISNVLPTPTPKPATVKKKSSSKISVTTSSKTISSKTTAKPTATTTSAENTNPPATSSSQPTWGQMQLPTTASPYPTTEAAAVSPPGTTTTSPLANSTSSDVPRNVLFTGIAAAFVCALLLWWRRFKHP